MAENAVGHIAKTQILLLIYGDLQRHDNKDSECTRNIEKEEFNSIFPMYTHTINL